jgi:hypothetical protein
MKTADAPDVRPTSTTPAELVDRVEAVDALYRFGAGQDLRDRALVEAQHLPRGGVGCTIAASRWRG